jgi:15,16-dihydrobiliverdin:ferredoxin oxidoreductase
MLNEVLNTLLANGFEEQAVPEAIALQYSSAKPARIGNREFRNSIFRKVRLTYFDGEDSVQVFNALFYPSYEYDLPLLGMDLISLGRKRVLNVIDTQPLYPTPEYSAKYVDSLSPIRERYPDLQGTLSGKIYDDTSFFSKNMLFGRFSDESQLDSVVQPALSEYLSAYLAMAAAATPDGSDTAMEAVRARQQAYDEYSALKDPAVGLFDAYYGKEWSKAFVHDFLFELSGAPAALAVPNPHAAMGKRAVEQKTVEKQTVEKQTVEQRP